MSTWLNRHVTNLDSPIPPAGDLIALEMATSPIKESFYSYFCDRGSLIFCKNLSKCLLA